MQRRVLGVGGKGRSRVGWSGLRGSEFDVFKEGQCSYEENGGGWG